MALADSFRGPAILIMVGHGACWHEDMVLEMELRVLRLDLKATGSEVGIGRRWSTGDLNTHLQSHTSSSKAAPTPTMMHILELPFLMGAMFIQTTTRDFFPTF